MPSNYRTKDSLIEQLFATGTFKYTTTDPLGETHFILTDTTNPEAIIQTHPSAQYKENNTTIRNINITGTIKNGIITRIHAEFTVTVKYNENTTRTTHYTLTLKTTTTPDWVQNYNTTQTQPPQS